MLIKVVTMLNILMIMITTISISIMRLPPGVIGSSACVWAFLG